MPKFIPIPSFDSLSPQTTKGDLIGRTTVGATRIAVGADNTVLTADSSLALGVKWASAAANFPVNALTGATTLPATSQIVLASGTTFAITLPSPASNSGLQYYIAKADTGTATPISITGTGFAGATLATTLETYYIVCDGSTFWPLGHSYKTKPVAYTPTFTGFGTATGVNFVSWRLGSYLFVQGVFTAGTPTATEGRISLGFDGTDSNVTTVSTLPTLSVAGDMTFNTSGVNILYALQEASKTYMTFGDQASGTNAFSKQNGNLFNPSTTISVSAHFPIAGWG